MGKLKFRAKDILQFNPKQNDNSKVRRYYSDWREHNGMIERCDNPACVFHSKPLEWNKKPLRMILDHKNGNRHDNRVENLRLLCPNCNSQLETAGGRNRGRIQNETESGFEVANRDGRRDALVAPRGVSMSARVGSVAVYAEGPIRPSTERESSATANERTPGCAHNES